MDWRVSFSTAAALLLTSIGANAASELDAYKVDASFLHGKTSLHAKDPVATLSGSQRRAFAAKALHNALHAAQTRNTATFGAGVPGIDSLANFTGQFTASPNLDANGVPLPPATFEYAMVGNAPGHHQGANIYAPIIPVSVELLDANGNQAFDPQSGAKLFSSPKDKIGLVEGSPIFDKTRYTSSGTVKTQFTDALHRAQFYNAGIDGSWHTSLEPHVQPGLTMKVPFGAYFYATNADGSCCAFILVDDGTFGALLFPPTFPVDKSTIVGAAEVSGAMTPHRITTFIFPDTYLFQGGDPNNCCVLGFHTFDSEPGTTSNGNLPRFYVLDYSSWISPGLFGAGFEDVTALSHEMAETFTDPFVGFDNVHNITPWWLSGSQCQNLMENGDVIESLPDRVTSPILMPNGFLYHVQNIPMLSWFEFQSPSAAIGGTYSYPDTQTLTALSPPQKVGCAP